MNIPCPGLGVLHLLTVFSGFDMAVTKVKTVIDRCRTVLKEVSADGTRWTNTELVDWLNEFYLAAAGIAPGKFSEVRAFECQAGTQQELPTDMEQLLEVVRNLDGRMGGIQSATKAMMDTTRRAWHGDPHSNDQELFVLDERFPSKFYVWPPAAKGSRIEIAGVVLPKPHTIGDYDCGEITIHCSDRLAPAMHDYILFRAYSKDSEDTVNAGLAQSHYATYMQSMTGGKQIRFESSPKNAAEGNL